MTTQTQPTPPKQGVRARERNALERITGLEQDFGRLIQSVQAAFNELENKYNTLSEVLDASVSCLGSEMVQAEINANRLRIATARADAQREALEKEIASGTKAPIETVQDGCLVVGKETDKDGKDVLAGYVQIELNNVKPQFKEKMMGQNVGFKFDTEVGGSFEILGLYQTVTPPAAADGSPSMSEDAPGTPSESTDAE